MLNQGYSIYSLCVYPTLGSKKQSISEIRTSVLSDNWVDFILAAAAASDFVSFDFTRLVLIMPLELF
jgi:hypothetical protein